MPLVVFYVANAALFLVAFWAPPTAFVSVAMLFGLKQWLQANDSFFIGNNTLQNYVTAGITCAAIIGTYWRRPGQLMAHPPTFWASLALFVYTLASVYWSRRPEIGESLFVEMLPYILLHAALVPLIFRTSADLRPALLCTLLVGSALAALLIFDTTWQDRSILLSIPLRTKFGEIATASPLAVASLGGEIAIIALVYSPAPTLLRLVGLLSGLALVVRSGSRGQQIALLGAAIICIPIAQNVKSLRGFASTLFGVAVLAACVSWAHSTYAVSSRWATAAATSEYKATRVETSERVIRLWWESGDLLQGMGNSTSYQREVLGDYPHVVPAEVLAEEGVVGLALFVTVLCLAIAAFARALAKNQNREAVTAFGALFIFHVILCCKEGSLLGNTELFGTAVILGRLGYRDHMPGAVG